MRTLIALFSVWLLVAPANAQCVFDAGGTITNPDAASCRDARFEITESETGPDKITLGYAPPLPVDSLTAVDGFRFYDSLHAQHQALMLGTNNVRGDIVGQTLAGRDIWAYRIGDSDNVTPDGFAEPAVMINGGIHAREWQSPEVVTEIFEQLVEKSDDAGIGQYLAEHLNVVILPVMNIDGFIQTQNFPTQVAAAEPQPRDGRLRRKNLRRPSGGAVVDADIDTSADQFDGVDLNRNTRHGFAQNGGSSNNPISLVYRGTAIASEPETTALLAAANLGPGDRLRFYVDAHSFTRALLLPSTTNTRRNALTDALARQMRAVSQFRYFLSVDPAGSHIGTTADYFAVEYDIPSWTLEIEPRMGGQDYGGTGASHSGFILPDNEIARVRDEIADMTLLGYYRQAGPPSVTAVQISRRADDTVVYRADWQTNAANGTRTLQVSVDDMLIDNEGYRLWVAFDKPMRSTVDGINAALYPGQDPAALGSVSFDAGADTADLQVSLAGDLSNWLGTSGGAPNGYQRYQFDAFAVDLDLPALSASQRLALSLDVQDMSTQPLDANPATAVDWQDGHWVNYEDAFDATGDAGGADCQLSVKAGPAGAAAPAATAVACKATFVAPPAPPAPGPVVTPQSSGGGGASGPWIIVLLSLVAWRRRR